MRGDFHMMKNDHGVALIIVLLVTALLIALVFEFAYSTRVSLHAAINFRDSQRAYFLARAGIKYCLKYSADPQTVAHQGKWVVVPFVSTGDTELNIKWEDEEGKLNLKLVNDADVQDWIAELFSNHGIDKNVVVKIAERGQSQQFQLISELHQLMSDEDYNKVSPYLTLYSPGKSVNINTTSEAVLQSMRISNPSLITAHAAETPYKQGDFIPGTTNVQTRGTLQNISNFLVTTSSNTTSKVYSYATVGGYTKQIEVIMNSAGVVYWKEL